MSKPSAFKFLAIDDDPQDLGLITDALAQEGLELLTASDSEAGFGVFLQARPKTVVISLTGPESDRMDLLERLVHADPAVNVILVTDHYSTDSAVEAIQKGACDYLTKPIDFRILRHRIAGFLAEAEIRHQAMALLELLRLSPLSSDYAGTLSGGQRKLLELGRALMVQPRMILLDEPMAGVAPVLALQLLEHIRELRERRGVTVCVIEHDMDVVMSISDRVIVMDEGRVIAAGSPDAVQRDERVIEAYLGRLEQP